MPQIPSSNNPAFDRILNGMAIVHRNKSNDYANEDPYSNFKTAADIANVSVDQVFMTLLGVKLARMRELTTTGKTPKNETVTDTRLDIAVYSAIWAAYAEDEDWGPDDTT